MSQDKKSLDCLREEELLNDEEFRRKFSYWKNDGSEPLKDLTVGKLIEDSAISYGDRIAVSSILQNKRLTYKELHDLIQSFAIGLIALDVKKGDHIGIWAPNSLEWIVSMFAIMKAGFVAVNLNPQYQCSELRAALEKGHVKVILIGDSLNERIYYEQLRTIVPELSGHDRKLPVKSETLPHLKVVITMTDVEYGGAIRWCDILSMGTDDHKSRLRLLEKETDTHDVCSIQFSSGTTGSSKAICLTHHMIVNNSYFSAKRMMMFEKPHVLCLPVPLFHLFGSMGLLTSAHTGTTVVLPSKKYSPSKSIEAIVKEKCTTMFGTPTMFTDIVTMTQKIAQLDWNIYEKISSLKIGSVGASFCTSEMVKKMKDVLRIERIFVGYGMTESGVNFLSNLTDTEEQTCTTVGSVSEHVEVKIIDDSGKIVPFGKIGECCFRGYSVMKGYYNDQANTDKVFLPGGWIRSGDKLILTEDGYGQIVGRIKDTINRGGENIEPSEIEEILAGHPDIINVQVFGVKDARLDEAVAAAVMKRENSQLSEDEVKKYCEGKMRPSKIPIYVEFVLEYPLTASGKVVKSLLRENFERKYNLI